MGFEFLTKDEVAQRVHISRRYLEQRIAAGTGPETLQVGRRVLISADAFAAWIGELKNAPAAAAVTSPTE